MVASSRSRSRSGSSSSSSGSRSSRGGGGCAGGGRGGLPNDSNSPNDMYLLLTLDMNNSGYDVPRTCWCWSAAKPPPVSCPFAHP